MSDLLAAFGINWGLLIAQSVNFAIVLVALWYFLYKPVLATLAKRQKVVAKGVEDAARAGELLSGADGEALSRIATADAEAEAIVAAARQNATEEKVRLLQEAEQRAAAVTKDAQARAGEAAARAARESEQEVARVAMLAAEKILKRQYD